MQKLISLIRPLVSIDASPELSRATRAFQPATAERISRQLASTLTDDWTGALRWSRTTVGNAPPALPIFPMLLS